MRIQKGGKMKRHLKNVLSFILTASVILSSFAVGGLGAYAEGNCSVRVQYSVSDYGMFTLPPAFVEVKADLSDKYAEQIGFNDSGEEPTILDATIAAHIEMFGNDFTGSQLFKATGSAGITAAFGEVTSALSYRLNGETSDGGDTWYDLNTVVSDGDCVDFMFYIDTTYWSDYYTCFDKRNVTLNTDDSLTLTAQFDMFGYKYPADGIEVTVNGKSVGLTDDDSRISLTFDKAGKYLVSAVPDIENEEFFAPPYCIVTVDDFSKKKLGAAGYLLDSASNFSVENAVNYLTYLNAGYDMSEYNDEFVASLITKLKKDGNLGTDLGVYGAVITILQKLGLNPESFYGFNITEQFESLPADSISNPYYYRVAIEASNREFGLKLCDKFIEDYYTLGRGMNYWGYSCDNTAVFLTGIAKYKDDYKKYVDDAKKVIATYKTDGGYFYSYEYNTASPNSTATALMAYSAVGDVYMSNQAYEDLCKNFESDEAGVFLYGGKKNALATADALRAMEYYFKTSEIAKYEHKKEIEEVTAEGVEPTCTQVGYTKQSNCVICGKVISERKEISVKKHDYKIVSTYASFTKDGNVRAECTQCGDVCAKQEFYRPKTVKLSKTVYTYNGKVNTPKVNVKDVNGNTISSRYYAVSYSSGRKNVGKYTVKVTFKGIYTGTKTLTYTIKPKGTNVSKLTKGKKKITVKWKKQSKQVSGYQVQYSLDKNFKKNTKTATVKGVKKKAKTISKLKSKKKYYVRVRTYKTVKGKKYYSDWSKVKSVNTK